MEAMLGISLCSYLYLKLGKYYVFLIISYIYSSTKLEKRAEQVLPGSEGGWSEGGQGGEMAQTTYTHMNKCIYN
jgi:hypothetical protein